MYKAIVIAIAPRVPSMRSTVAPMSLALNLNVVSSVAYLRIKQRT